MAVLSLQHHPHEANEDAPNGTMAFLAHLDELRWCIALAIGMLVSFAFIGRMDLALLGGASPSRLRANT